MHPHSNGADVVSLGPHLNLGEMCHLMRKVAQGVHISFSHRLERGLGVVSENNPYLGSMKASFPGLSLLYCLHFKVSGWVCGSL